MSKLQMLLHKLIGFIRRFTAHGKKSQPDATLPAIETIYADEIDPDVGKMSRRNC